MALNITFDGYCFDNDGFLVNADVKYQAYFYRQNGSSSPSTWNSVRTVSSAGYWNINLGSGDWLTQDGSAGTGDIVLIVFWSPTSAGRLDDCGSLMEWGSIRIVLGSGFGKNIDGSVYTNDAQIKENICPNINWNLQSSADVEESVSIANSSTDIHQWNFLGPNTGEYVTMWQRASYYTTLQGVNSIVSTTYDWGDITQDVVVGTGAESHSWSLAGDYNIKIIIEDDCGCTVTGTDSIRIKWRSPTADITMTPVSPSPNETVSFQWTGTDIDDRITYIDWHIYDSGSYGDTDTITSGTSDAVIEHTEGMGTAWCGENAASGAFTNPGVHNVAITIHWNDGFDDQTINYNENFTQNKFTGPTVNFSQDPAPSPVGENIEFINTSTNRSRVGTGLPDCTEYNWYWTDSGITTSYLDKNYSYKLTQSSDDVDCQVKLCAYWSDGWDTYTTCTSGNVIFETTATVSEVECYYNLYVIGTSNNGTYSSYSWTVASGAGESGPWTEIWESPIGVQEQNKTICFTNTGWYRATGYVYGTDGDAGKTSDEQIFYISEICPVTYSGVEVVPICEPEGHGHQFGKVHRTGYEIKPSGRANVDIVPSGRIINTFPLPRNL